MKRRQFIFTAATFALLGGCGVLPNLGQPAGPRVTRVGILDAAAADEPTTNNDIARLKQGLAELGYVDGQTIIFEQRDSEKIEQLPKLVNELVQLPVDVIVSLNSKPTQAARQATTVVPIVFIGVSDPVGQGLVASLAKPGGNLTGTTTAPPTVWAKQLQILAEFVPHLSRVAIMRDSSNPANALTLQVVTSAANALGVQLKPLDVRSTEDVEPALAEALAWQSEAMIISGGAGAVADAMPRLVDFSKQNHIPTTGNAVNEAQAGILFSYGTGVGDTGHAAAAFVDKIIKGARPADLPVEQPTVLQLVVNQTTAHALGITIPPEVAQQVTAWVQ